MDTKHCEPFFITKRSNIKSDLKYYDTHEIRPVGKCIIFGTKKLQELLEGNSILKIRSDFEESESLLNLEDARHALEIKIQHKNNMKMVQK